MKIKLSTLVLGFSVICFSTMAMAAEVINLQHQPYAVIEKYLTSSKSLQATQPKISIKRLSESADFNQTKHVRVKQEFSGYPVWGSDAVLHIKPKQPGLRQDSTPTISMNGVIYDKLEQDLTDTPGYVFKPEQAHKAMQFAIARFADQTAERFTTSQEKNQLMVYVDQHNKARWAYRITFRTSRIHQKMPARPVYILDAITFKVFRHWDNIKTRSLVRGGGVGGNPTMGKLIYDGLKGHMPELNFTRSANGKRCHLMNDTVVIKDVRNGDKVPYFKCMRRNGRHNSVYWNTLKDVINGGYSPENDGIYSDMIVRKMYQEWFNVAMLTDSKGKPLQVVFHVHDPMQGQNAYYDDGEMVFGDGDDESYPVVAPSVVGHEMSHGFTEQHANLIYDGQSGGINESFSDMADKAVEYFQYGKNNWELDPELLKEDGEIMRYMDEPTKDCKGETPGNECSISNANDYNNSIDVHFSSGVFNKAFYLIASKWNTKKAFEVMVQANMHYWTPNTTFEQAACGVIHATKDYHYDIQTVRDAMLAVGINTESC